MFHFHVFYGHMFNRYKLDEVIERMPSAETFRERSVPRTLIVGKGRGFEAAVYSADPDATPMKLVWSTYQVGPAPFGLGCMSAGPGRSSPETAGIGSSGCMPLGAGRLA